MSNVTIDNFSDAVTKAIIEYSEEIDKAMQDEVQKLSVEVKKSLENNSIIPKRTGKYVKSFYVKKEASGQGYKRNRIANREYRLTHLLEYGHLIPKTGGRTKAFPHWGQAEKLAETLDERLKTRLLK